MPRHLAAQALIDAQGVTELLGLAQRNTVSAHERRVVRPVVNLGQGRRKLSPRGEILRRRVDRLALSGR